MKRILVTLFILALLLFGVMGSSFAEEEWITSEDGILEVRMKKIDTSNYPKLDCTVEYRIDSSTTRSGTWTYDGTKMIGQHIANHPELKNRKVKMNAAIVSVSPYREGIQQTMRIAIDINGEIVDYMNAGLNLWEQFPEDFIDYDAIYAAAGLKKYKSTLLYPDSLKITKDVQVRSNPENDNVVYYVTNVMVKNSSGGQNNNEIGIIYNVANGKMNIIKLDKKNGYEYVVWEGANPEFTEKGLAVIEVTQIISQYTIKKTIWKRTVQKALK